MSAEQASIPEREPKWVAQTQVMQNQIREAREQIGHIRRSADFILKREPPTQGIPDDGPNLEEVESRVEDRKTVDDSPLTCRLEEIKTLLKEVNGELAEMLNLIDI